MLEDFPENQPMNESLTVMTGLAATIIFTLPTPQPYRIARQFRIFNRDSAVKLRNHD